MTATSTNQTTTQLANEPPTRSLDELAAVIEALIFVNGEPLAAKQIAENLSEDLALVESVLENLAAEWNERGGGLQLRAVAGGWAIRHARRISRRPQMLFEHAPECEIIARRARNISRHRVQTTRHRAGDSGNSRRPKWFGNKNPSRPSFNCGKGTQRNRRTTDVVRHEQRVFAAIRLKRFVRIAKRRRF